MDEVSTVVAKLYSDITESWMKHSELVSWNKMENLFTVTVMYSHPTEAKVARFIHYTKNLDPCYLSNLNSMDLTTNCYNSSSGMTGACCG
jgi:hypothetical protein